MDACHWKVIYDGFKNTYTFHKDRHKIILAPLKQMMGIESKQEEKSSLLSKLKLEKDLEVRAKEIKELHEKVCLKIEKQNAKYVEQIDKKKRRVELEVRDLVLIHLCNDRFMPWKFGTLELM